MSVFHLSVFHSKWHSFSNFDTQNMQSVHLSTPIFAALLAWIHWSTKPLSQCRYKQSTGTLNHHKPACQSTTTQTHPLSSHKSSYSMPYHWNTLLNVWQYHSGMVVYVYTTYWRNKKYVSAASCQTFKPKWTLFSSKVNQVSFCYGSSSSESMVSSTTNYQEAKTIFDDTGKVAAWNLWHLRFVRNIKNRAYKVLDSGCKHPVLFDLIWKISYSVY